MPRLSLRTLLIALDGHQHFWLAIWVSRAHHQQKIVSIMDGTGCVKYWVQSVPLLSDPRKSKLADYLPGFLVNNLGKDYFENNNAVQILPHFDESRHPHSKSARCDTFALPQLPHLTELRIDSPKIYTTHKFVPYIESAELFRTIAQLSTLEELILWIPEEIPISTRAPSRNC